MVNSDKEFILRIPMNTYLSIKSPMKKAVFMAVYSFTDNGKGACHASQRSIAERAGCCQDTIKRLLPKLVNDGLLKVNGHRSVRGGNIPKYVVSERQSFSKALKVNDTAPEVNDGTPTETVKGNSKDNTQTFYKKNLEKQTGADDPTSKDFDTYMGLAEKLTIKHQAKK